MYVCLFDFNTNHFYIMQFVTFFIISFQILTSSITVIEGGDTEYVGIEVNFPPSFICRLILGQDVDCSMSIEAIFKAHKELDCFGTGDGLLQQAVLGWEVDDELDNAFCGIPVYDIDFG